MSIINHNRRLIVTLMFYFDFSSHLHMFNHLPLLLYSYNSQLKLLQSYNIKINDGIVGFVKDI